MTKVEREALATILEAVTKLQTHTPSNGVSDREIAVRKELAKNLRGDERGAVWLGKEHH